MKFLSFDVGINNLAYCLVKKATENLIIESWGLIRLNGEVVTCSMVKNNGNYCTNKATFYYIRNDVEHYVCGSHKNIDDPVSEQCIGKNCIYVAKTGNKCNKKTCILLDNKPLCNTHEKIIRKNIDLKPIKKKNSNKVSIDILSRNLFIELNNHPEFLHVNKVLIENQPTLKNPTMKTISVMLYSYFQLKGTVDNKFIESVEFIAPCNKLKIDPEAVKQVNKIKDNKSQAKALTKKLGIEICKSLIDEEHLEFLSSFKKQDDLCDAFLQVYYYVLLNNNK